MTDQRALCILCRSGQRMCLRGMSGTELKEMTAEQKKTSTEKPRLYGLSNKVTIYIKVGLKQPNPT